MDRLAFYAAYHNGDIARRLARHVELRKTAGEGVVIDGAFLEKLSADDWASGLSKSVSEGWENFKRWYRDNPEGRRLLWGAGGALAGYGVDRMLGGGGWLGGALGGAAGLGFAPRGIPELLRVKQGVPPATAPTATGGAPPAPPPAKAPAPAAPVSAAPDKPAAPPEAERKEKTVANMRAGAMAAARAAELAKPKIPERDRAYSPSLLAGPDVSTEYSQYLLKTPSNKLTPEQWGDKKRLMSREKTYGAGRHEANTAHALADALSLYELPFRGYLNAMTALGNVTKGEAQPYLPMW